MRTDRPSGRAMPPGETFEEPQVISIDVDPSSPGQDDPGPEYEDVVEAEELMQEEASHQVIQEGPASPLYIAPGDFQHQGDPPAGGGNDEGAPQSSQVVIDLSSSVQGEGTKERVQRTGGGGARGTKCRRLGPGDSGDSRGTQQECWCVMCTGDAYDDRRLSRESSEGSTRRFRAASTWTPRVRSRETSKERERSRSTSPRANSLKMKMIRSQLLHETLRQMREDEDAIEMARQEVINEFERGAEEFKRNDKKNKNSDKCKRCIQEDLMTRTRAYEEENKETHKEAFEGIRNLKSIYDDKMETLMSEVRGETSKDREFDPGLLTRVVQDEGEIRLLQLRDQEQTWRSAKIPRRQLGVGGAERSTPLLMAVPEDIGGPEGGLVVTGVASKTEGRNISQGDLCVGKIQDKGGWVVEGHIESVCPNAHCFVACWTKMFATQRIRRHQHMAIAWESCPQGVKYAGEVRKCTKEGKQFSNLPKSKAGTPCRIFPMEAVPGGRPIMDYAGRRMIPAERGRVLNANMKDTVKPRIVREVVLVRDEETGVETYKVRVQAEKMSAKQMVEARAVYRQRVGLQTEDNEGESSEEETHGQHQRAGAGKE